MVKPAKDLPRPEVQSKSFYLFIRTWKTTSVKILTPASLIQEGNKRTPIEGMATSHWI